jgi:hypothetical protein
VHAIESVGGVATCAPMGAGRWNQVDAEPLYGAKLIVVADKDAPGYQHARDILASLDALVEADLPDAIGEPAVTVVTLADVVAERVTWLWDGHLPAGNMFARGLGPVVGWCAPGGVAVWSLVTRGMGLGAGRYGPKG